MKTLIISIILFVIVTNCFSQIWEQTSLPTQTDYVRDEFFLNADIGWIITGSYNLGSTKIFKTVNGGSSWSTTYNFGNLTIGPASIHFINEYTGWIAFTSYLNPNPSKGYV